MGEPKTDTKKSPAVAAVPDAPRPSADERWLEAIETLVLTAGEALYHLAALAKAATRLADKFAPEAGPQLVPGRIGGRQCGRGHGMQMADDYCQTCFRQDNPKPGPRAA